MLEPDSSKRRLHWRLGSLFLIPACSIISACHRADQDKPDQLIVPVADKDPTGEADIPETTSRADEDAKKNDNVSRARFDSIESSLQSVEQNRPILQSRMAFKDGDRRFLGIMSIAIDVPGISEAAHDTHVTKDSVRIIAGTSDYISDDSVERLMDIAPAYAEKFNIEMLRQIETDHPLPEK
jgi:hypothetical protein